MTTDPREPSREAMEIARAYVFRAGEPFTTRDRLACALSIDAHTATLRAQLAAAVEALLRRIRDNHAPDCAVPFCCVCGAEGGRFPCATRLEADAALRALGVDPENVPTK